MDNNKSDQGFRLGETIVFPNRGEMHVGGDVRHVEPRVMEVLVLLADRQGKVVSRDTLIQEVWRGALISDDVISRCIYQLRKELDDNDRSLIATVPKRGYRLMQTAIPISESPEFTKPKAARVRTVGGLWAASLLAGVLVVIALSYIKVSWQSPGSTAPYIVAVTRFAGDTAGESDVLGPGLANDLLYRLSRNRELGVLARSTSFQNPTSIKDALAGENLVVLEGSISEQGDHWILSVRLVDANTGGELWSTRLATEDLAIIDIQRQIELGITQALKAMPDSMVLPDSGFASNDLKAFHAVLQGREWMKTRDAYYLNAAGEQFALAAGLDPDYAAAYSSLAELQNYLMTYAGRNWDELRDLAKESVRRALELDPNSAHAHAVNGLVYYTDNKMELAKPALRKAIELNPGFSDAYQWLGLVHMAQAAIEEALEVYKISAALSPLAATPQMNIGMAYQSMGQFETALEYYAKAIELNPEYGNANWAAGYAHWRIGALPEAIEQFREADRKKIVNADFFAQFGLACFEAGCIDEGRQYAAMSTKLNPIQLWSVRATWGSYLVNGDMHGVVNYFENVNESPKTRVTIQMNRAKAYAISDRWEDALEVYETQYLAAEPWFFYQWDIEWGFSHALMLIAARKQLGSDYSDVVDRLEHFIGEVEDLRAASAGLTYVHACIAAIEGSDDVALELLEAAHGQGWRRWWWTDVDPSWVDLRGNDAFETLVSSLKTSPDRQVNLAKTGSQH